MSQRQAAQVREIVGTTHRRIATIIEVAHKLLPPLHNCFESEAAMKHGDSFLEGARRANMYPTLKQGSPAWAEAAPETKKTCRIGFGCNLLAS